MRLLAHELHQTNFLSRKGHPDEFIEILHSISHGVYNTMNGYVARGFLEDGRSLGFRIQTRSTA